MNYHKILHPEGDITVIHPKTWKMLSSRRWRLRQFVFSYLPPFRWLRRCGAHGWRWSRFGLCPCCHEHLQSPSLWGWR